MKPVDSELQWKNINFFENDFSDDVGNILFGQPASQNIDLMSPCNTSDGWLKKKWKIIDGKRCLIKAGSNPFMQEPINEVFGTSLWHDKLTRAINPLGKVETKPFYANASKQMELVSDFSWIPFESLENLKNDIMDIFVPTEFIDEQRVEILAKAVSSRVEDLQTMEMEQKRRFTLGILQ